MEFQPTPTPLGIQIIKSRFNNFLQNILIRLVNPENNGLNAPAIGYGTVGAKGFAYYSEVCNFTSQPTTAMRWDNESKVPYAFNNYDWISYDNVTSVEFKVRMNTYQQNQTLIFTINLNRQL